MIHRQLIAFAFVAAFGIAPSLAETNVTLSADANAPRIPVNPSLYSIFFEEINHAGEGGLYAELVLNRDFEITTPPRGVSWAGNLLRTEARWQERKWFGNELWDEILQTHVNPPGESSPAKLFALAGFERKTGDVLLRVVNRAATPREMQIQIQGVAAIDSVAKVTTLSHDDPTAEKTVDQPDAVLPTETTLDRAGAEFTCKFEPYSFTLIRLTPAKTP